MVRSSEFHLNFSFFLVVCCRCSLHGWNADFLLVCEKRRVAHALSFSSQPLKSLKTPLEAPFEAPLKAFPWNSLSLPFKFLSLRTPPNSKTSIIPVPSLDSFQTSQTLWHESATLGRAESTTNGWCLNSVFGNEHTETYVAKVVETVLWNQYGPKGSLSPFEAPFKLPFRSKTLKSS